MYVRITHLATSMQGPLAPACQVVCDVACSDLVCDVWRCQVAYIRRHDHEWLLLGCIKMM